MQRNLYCKFVSARVPFCVALLFSLVWSRLRSGIDLTFIGFLLLKGGPCQLLALGFQLPCALSGHLDPSACALLGRGLIGRTAQRRQMITAGEEFVCRPEGTCGHAQILMRGCQAHVAATVETHVRFAFCMCRKLATGLWLLAGGPFVLVQALPCWTWCPVSPSLHPACDAMCVSCFFFCSQCFSEGFQLPCALSGHLDPSACALLGRGLIGRTAQRRQMITAGEEFVCRPEGTCGHAQILMRGCQAHVAATVETHVRFAFCMCRKLATGLWLLAGGPFVLVQALPCWTWCPVSGPTVACLHFVGCWLMHKEGFPLFGWLKFISSSHRGVQ